MEINDENLKIEIIFPAKRGKLLANATVSIKTIEYGFVTMKGFQIWTSSQMNSRLQESINITPPTRMMFGRYICFIWLENENRWHELESKIYDAFYTARQKKTKSEDVKSEEIPF